jgi:LysM repeat protein
MHYGGTWAAVVAICCASWAGEARAKTSHVVSAGDTLWGISKSYGCEVKALRQVNSLGGEHLNIGQELQIPSCEKRRVVVAPEGLRLKDELVTHQVVAGDTLGKIATRYRSSIEDIQERNQLDDTTIVIGGRLLVKPESSAAAAKTVVTSKSLAVVGQSVGLPHKGRLKKAIKLAQGKGYYIRRPHRSFGASHTVGYVKSSLAQMRKRFPNSHDLAIGDLSARGGGKITMHASHQSGRDVDIGFYFKTKPKGYPESFIVANRKNIDFEASWALLTQFTDLANKPDGVDRIFMSYSSQKMFYKLARKHGVPKRKLKRIFQYPDGRWAQSGIIRHEPGHDEHIHVRFKCPPKDKGCS